MVVGSTFWALPVHITKDCFERVFDITFTFRQKNIKLRIFSCSLGAWYFKHCMMIKDPSSCTRSFRFFVPFICFKGRRRPLEKTVGYCLPVFNVTGRVRSSCDPRWGLEDAEIKPPPPPHWWECRGYQKFPPSKLGVGRNIALHAALLTGLLPT